MDVGRFYYAVDVVCRDWRATAAIDSIAALISHLSNFVANSGHPQFLDQYKHQLDATKLALEASDLNFPKFEVADFIERFELAEFVGNGLFATIMSAISQNQMAPQAVIVALQELQVNLSKKISDLNAINSAFASIKVPYDGEISGDSEIEIKIPAVYGAKNLNDLAVEAKEWYRDISTISEVFDPDRPDTKIRTLATGSWQIYLVSAPLVIFGIAKCLRGVNAILQELIRSKALLGELVKTNAPDKVVKDYDKHIKTSTGTNLFELSSRLVEDNYRGGDDGRKAELKVALTQSLKRLSKKISEGSKVGLRLTKPDPAKVTDEANPTEDEAAAIEAVKKLESIITATTLELDEILRLEHDPEIVKSLPPPEDDPV